MDRIGSKLFHGLIALLVLCGIGWWLIGPDWRALLAHPPSGQDVLFWSQKQRDAGFRMMDRIPFIIKSRTIEAGDAVSPLPEGEPLDLGPEGGAMMEALNYSSIVVLQDGKIRLESYGLDFEEDGRWTSFSVAKSFTSTLVGAALKDGYIDSLDDKVSDYVPGLRGSAYDDVSIHQILTMTSGVAWNEDYEDPNSDVALFLATEPEGDMSAVVTYMKDLGRAHPPGDVFNYSTGETNLIGILVRRATGKTLAEYLSEKIWKPYGMQQDASWLLGSDGREISGCCIQAAARDYARFGQFILQGARIDGEPVLADGYLEAATGKQTGIGNWGYGYGYQWWIRDENTFEARGIFGQGILIDPTRNLVIITTGNWTSAIGYKDGEAERRSKFFSLVQSTIDQELAATGG